MNIQSKRRQIDLEHQQTALITEKHTVILAYKGRIQNTLSYVYKNIKPHFLLVFHIVSGTIFVRYT